MTDPNAPQLDPDLAALRRVAAAILRDSASADDIVQEAWLASVGKAGRSPEERRNWLRGVVRNLAKSHQRDHVRRRERERMAARHERVDSEPSRQLDDEMVKRLLSNAVDSLDEPYATVIRDKFMLAKTTAEIAQRVRRTESTVQRQIKHGLDRLRTQLGPQFGGGRALGIALVRAFDWTPADIVGKAAIPVALPATVTGGAWWLRSLPHRSLTLASLWLLPIVLVLFVAVQVLGVGGQDEVEGVEPGTVEVASAPTAQAAPVTEVLQDVPTGPQRVPQESPSAAAHEDGEANSSVAVPASPPLNLFRRIQRLKVLDVNGNPVAQAKVELAHGELSREVATTGPEGLAEFDVNVTAQAPGESSSPSATVEARIRATAPGHADSGEYFLPLEESDRRIVLRLNGSPITIEGTVSGPDGRAVEGALISVDPMHLGQGVVQAEQPLVSVDGDTFFDVHRGTRSDEEGRFVLSGLTRKSHVLTARADGLMDGEITVDFDGAAPATADFSLREGAVVMGRVLGPDGLAFPKASVQFEPLHSARTGARTFESGTDGKFRLDGAQVGDARLRAEAVIDGVRHQGVTSLVLRHGAVEPAVVRLEPSKGIRLRVVDAEGTAVADGGLIVSMPDHSWKTKILRLGGDGEVSVDAVPQVPLLVMVMQDGTPFPLSLHTVDPTQQREHVLESPRQHGRTGAIQGKLRLGGELPPSQCRVRVEAHTSTAGREAEVSVADGSFHLEGIPAGDYLITVLTPSSGGLILKEQRFDGQDLDLGTVDPGPMAAIAAKWTWPVDDRMSYKLVQIFRLPAGYIRRLKTIEVGSAPNGAPVAVMPGCFGYLIKDHRGDTVQSSASLVPPGFTQPVFLGPEGHVTASISFSLEGYPESDLSVAVHVIPDRADLDDLSEGELAKLISPSTIVSRLTTTRCWGEEHRIGLPMDHEGRWVFSVDVPGGRRHTMLAHRLPEDEVAFSGFVLRPEETIRTPLE